MVAACSKESLWFRFRYVLKETTHEMATRFCYLDYDREMAIVAEIEEAGERRLIGIGRLMANVDHTEAEYAVLVTDAWQGTGLGSLLTDYCLEICRSWGISRVVAETSPDNARMLHLFRNRGFEMRQDVMGDSVLVQKELG
jgi:acetyltransferase